MIKLVIFDCDGVLVDSEAIFNTVLHTYLNEHGAALSFDDCCALFIGKNRYAVEAHLRGIGIELPQDWAEQFYTRAIELLRREVVEIPSVRAVLEQLCEAGVPVCVASNGLPAKMDATLQTTRLLPFFTGRIYSAYDIGASKPAPDVFLHAARMDGVAPADCVVIEDSASGFEAAARAGMRCFAYCPNGMPPDLFGAQAFTDMADLPARLGLA